MCMRSKIVVIISIVLLSVIGFIVYKGISSKSIDDYTVEQEPFYDAKIDNYEFYIDGISNNDAIDIANMMSLLGVENDVSVGEIYLVEDKDTEDMDRDNILSYDSDVDFDLPVYCVFDGDIYYMYSDTSGDVHGLHLDSDLNLVELR